MSHFQLLTHYRTSTTTKYDQTFNQVKGNTAAMIDFKVAPKKVSLEHTSLLLMYRFDTDHSL
jgi:hypothetical protein